MARPIWETEEDVLVEVIDEEQLDDISTGAVLIVHNDEYNTFEWVIESLVKVCKHTYEQAEQCSIFIHFKGKYGVKHGTKKELRPMKDALIDRGLNVTIEENN